jgi:DNA polymerase
MNIEKHIRAMMTDRKECSNCPLYGHQTVILEQLYDNKKNCDVLFYGINPGKQEAKYNRPFIGSSGKLLRRKIEGVGLFNFNVAFTNAILCSTPNEKDIPDVEICISHCKGLTREITKLMKPKIFVPVGQNSTSILFEIEGKISNLSGKLVKKGRHKIIPVIHPASAIYNRNGPAAEILVQSLENIKKELENGLHS